MAQISRACLHRRYKIGSLNQFSDLKFLYLNDLKPTFYKDTIVTVKNSSLEKNRKRSKGVMLGA